MNFHNKNIMYFSILIMLLIPFKGNAQFVIEKKQATKQLSPVAETFVNQVKTGSGNTTRQQYKGSIFNLAITSRFDFGMVVPMLEQLPFSYDLFNVTSLEMYFSVSDKLRFITTFRFSTPVLPVDNIMFSLYHQRLGWGLGIAAVLNDARNAEGRGLMSTFNVLFSGDYYINYSTPSYLEEENGLYKLEFGIRLNRFVARNLAFVFGIDLGVGGTFGEISPVVGNDNYPIEPLSDIGEYFNLAFTVGATVGIMF